MSTTAPAAAPFELGLVMAGAVSAGAYTAGVLDFLYLALDEWQAALARGEPVPDHRVQLRVVTGASAGGICGAIALSEIAWRSEPVAADPGPRCANRFFDTWVNRIDISALLGSADPMDQGPRALLDCTVLDEVAASVLQGSGLPRQVPWVAPQLDLLMTVTNLRGVPYSLGFQGSTQRDGMVSHADHVHWSLSADGQAGPPAALRLRWDQLGQRTGAAGLMPVAALATAAFPVALQPRVLRYDFAPGQPDLYSQRPLSFGNANQMACDWGPAGAPRPYEFLCVDGGVMNNEPLELARRCLAGAQGYNPRPGELATRALLMIDPFPEGEALAPDYSAPAQADLLATGFGLFSALIQQSRFKPEELALASDPEVFSRFLISPVRKDNQGQAVRGSASGIASAALGGFAGFLDRGLRLHDFLLGRRNAQQFLRAHLDLPAVNPLFDSWSGAAWASGWQHEGVHGEAMLPIIPLLGRAALPIALPDWPQVGRARLAEVGDALGHRYQHVTQGAIGHYIPSWLGRVAAKLLAASQRDAVVAKLGQVLQAELGKADLLG